MTAVYQPSLYEAQVMPAHNGTPTSAAAAAQALPSVTPQTLQVLALLAKRGAYGATQDEAAVELGIERSSLCARFNAAADSKQHWIEPTINTRRTRFGRAAVVYVITAAGRERLATGSDPACRDAAGVTATRSG
jgi:DNA-binding MarR family transcriptional regulator